MATLPTSLVSTQDCKKVYLQVSQVQDYEVECGLWKLAGTTKESCKDCADRTQTITVTVQKVSHSVDFCMYSGSLVLKLNSGQQKVIVEDVTGDDYSEMVDELGLSLVLLAHQYRYSKDTVTMIVADMMSFQPQFFTAELRSN